MKFALAFIEVVDESLENYGHKFLIPREKVEEFKKILNNNGIYEYKIEEGKKNNHFLFTVNCSYPAIRKISDAFENLF